MWRVTFLLALASLLSTSASAPPLPPHVDVGVRLPRVVVTHTSNSQRAGIAVRELLAERVDVAGLPPRTPISIWREVDDERHTSRIVGFRVVVDGRPLTALRSRVNDVAFCGAAEVCEAFVDNDGVTLDGSTLASPVDAWTVSSRVGERIHPISHRRRFHAGTDYAAPMGTPVVSVMSGEVIRSARSWTAGRFVVVRHDDRSEAKYFHLDERFVEAGQRVARGDLVGVVGKTGRVTGPHLHFEMRDRRGTPLDMAAERWPGRARVDVEDLEALQFRLRLIAGTAGALWPLGLDAVPAARHSDFDLGVFVANVFSAEVRAEVRARVARRRRPRR